MTIINKALVFFFIVFFCLNAFALSISVEKNSFEKSEKILFSLECTPFQKNSLSALEKEKEVFFHEFDCPSEGLYDFNYQSSFLDPKGNWRVVLKDNENTAEKAIIVNEPREAGFLIVKFLSPPLKTFYRGEKIVVSVNLKDNDVDISDANVFFWSVDGKKIPLRNSLGGNYIFDYTIPLGARTGDWELLVLAEKNTGQKIGGSALLSLKVEKAPLVLEVLKPSAFYFDLGQKVEFVIKAYYPDNSFLSNGKAKVVFLEKEFELTSLDGNMFGKELDLTGFSLGSVQANIVVEDEFGNSGSTTLDMVAGCSVTCLLANYGLIALTAIVIIFIFARLVFSKTSYHLEIKKLEAEKEKNLELIKNLQSNYFAKGTINPDNYRKDLAQYKEKISELEEKISKMKNKLEDNK